MAGQQQQFLFNNLMQLKENNLFSRWKKVYVTLTTDELTLRVNQMQLDNPFARYPMKNLIFQEVNGSGKENCTKVSVKVDNNNDDKKKKKKKSSFMLSCSALNGNAWWRALQDADAKRDEPVVLSCGISRSLDTIVYRPPVSTARSRLEVVDIKNWNAGDVQEWLGYIRAENGGAKMVDQYGELFFQNDIDGRTLLAMDDNALKGIGIQSTVPRVKLLTEIEKLKDKKTYSLNEHLVMSKFERMNSKYTKGYSNLVERVQSLCDVDKIKERYLNPNRIEIHDPGNESEEDDDSFSIVDEEEPHLQEENKLKVKLIVTEITHTDSQKSLRKILSPIAANIPAISKTKYGLFHTALIVGPWYLEWNDSSLCIPKRISSSMAIISADVDNIIIPKSSDKRELVEKLAEVIVDWNVNKDYVNYKPVGKKSNEGNCQDFVEAVMDKLDLNPTFTGALGNFFKDMKNKGTCEMIFRPEDSFIEKFQLSEKEYSFSNHRELDQFVLRLSKMHPTLHADHPSERSLLKSFDRAFWLRHIRNPEIEEFQPTTEEIKTQWGKKRVCKCPFDDPRVTKSFR